MNFILKIQKDRLTKNIHFNSYSYCKICLSRLKMIRSTKWGQRTQANPVYFDILIFKFIESFSFNII